MDKLRDVLTFLNKYGFWISCVLVALVVVGLWYQSTGTIQAEAKKNLSDLNAKKNGVVQVKAVVSHPNATTEIEMKKLLEGYGLEVAKGWDLVYTRQKKVLEWPKAFTEAKGNFAGAVKNLRPIEIVPFSPTPTPDKPEMVAFTYRQQYRDFIELEIPKLAERIGAEWSVKNGAEEPLPTVRPGVRPGDLTSGVPAAPLPMVDWSPTNQTEIMSVHFPFTQPEAPTPTTLEMLYAQETLWVLESLVDIIKEVNGDAEARYQTAIHGIEGIQVGRTAGGVSGVVTPLIDANAPTAGLEAGAGARIGGANPLGSLSTGPGSTMPPGVGEQPADANAKPDPAAGRYVDQNYEPLDATRLRAALTPTPTKPEDVVLAVAKRMPVRLRLKIDQRKMNLLLAACGNSRLPLEVRQIRINREAGAAGTNSPAVSMPAYRGPGEGRMPPVFRGGGEGRPPGPSAMPSGPNVPDVDPNEITLEVFGIVYIFNPVNTALLGITEEQLKSALGAPQIPVVPGVPVGPAAPPPAGAVAPPVAPVVAPQGPAAVIDNGVAAPVPAG